MAPKILSGVFLFGYVIINIYYSPEDPSVSSETRFESYSGDGNHIIGRALGLQGAVHVLSTFKMFDCLVTPCVRRTVAQLLGYNSSFVHWHQSVKNGPHVTAKTKSFSKRDYCGDGDEHVGSDLTNRIVCLILLKKSIFSGEIKTTICHNS